MPHSVGQHTKFPWSNSQEPWAEQREPLGTGQGGGPILHVLLCSNKMMMSHCRRLPVPITPLSYTHWETG